MNADLIVTLLVTITGLIGAPIIQVIKEYIGWEGKPALWLAVGISVVLAAGISFANGIFFGVEPTVESVAAAATAVFSLATIIYKVLVQGKPEEPVEE